MDSSIHLESRCQDRSPSPSSRPRSEDKLGLISDNDDAGGGEDRVPSESLDDSSNMDDTVVSGLKIPGYLGTKKDVEAQRIKKMKEAIVQVRLKVAEQQREVTEVRLKVAEQQREIDEYRVQIDGYRVQIDGYRDLATEEEIQAAEAYDISISLFKRLKSASGNINDILRDGVEENYHVRVMVVGKEGVGKTTLTRRLLKLPVNIQQYNSTDGIDVHIGRCEVDLKSGDWSTKSLDAATEGKCDYYVRYARILQSAGPPKQFDSTDHTKPTSQESAISEDMTKYLEAAKEIQSQKGGRKARFDFYDFAGQDVYQTSHPTFLSSTAIFLVVVSLKELYEGHNNVSPSVISHSARQQKSEILPVQKYGSLHKWLNVIYMSDVARKNVRPHVLLVGTHADTLPSERRAEIIEKCFDKFRDSIEEKPFISILAEDEYGVNNTDENDPNFSAIKTKILALAKSEETWGHKTPSKWLPIGREIDIRKDAGIKVLPLENLRDINRNLEINLSSEEEMTMFLLHLHDNGEIIYFNEEDLKDVIILDPVWMIDAVKTIITADRFAKRKPVLNKLWKEFRNTGVITKSAIVSIFEAKGTDRSLFENHEHAIRLMEKFLFIAAPVSTGQTDGASMEADVVRTQDKFIMPCMVDREPESCLLTKEEGKSKTTVLGLMAEYVPPAVFHKVLVTCITQWPILVQNGRNVIFPWMCSFNIDKYSLYILTVFHVENTIQAKIVSYKDELQPSHAVCRPVREFLTLSMTYVLRAMGLPSKVKIGIQCPKILPGSHGGFHDFDSIKSQPMVGCTHCPETHVLEAQEMLGSWESMVEAGANYEGGTSLFSVGLEGNSAGAVGGTSIDINKNSGEIASAVGDSVEGELEVLDTTENRDLEASADFGPITQEHINQARLCNVIVTVLSGILRDILVSQVPVQYPDIYKALLANSAALRTMRQIRQEQFCLIFPDPQMRYTGKVDQFDITLLYALIRNISSCQAPATGWGVPPSEQPRDTTLSANVERIRLIRNKVSGHSNDGRLEDQEYEDYMAEIGLILDDVEVVLGDNGYKRALEERRKQIITPKDAQILRKKFQNYQKQLKEKEMSVQETLDKLQENLDVAREQVSAMVALNI